MQRWYTDEPNGTGDENGHTVVNMEVVTGPTSHLQQEGYSRSERVAQEKAGLLYGRPPSDFPFQGQPRSMLDTVLISC